MSALLEVEGLRVDYGGVIAVRDVSFDVSEGSTVALLGANGAGKTTTLRAISGLVGARSGSVRLDGRDILGMRPSSLARLGMAHVPAGRAIFGSLTVAENLRMGTFGAGVAGSPGADEAITRVMALFPILEERRDQPASTLSGGQQQMLAIGRALVQSPRLLMLDEMSMGLAPGVVAELFEAVAALRDEGVSVLMVEQFVEQALSVADHAVLLEQGVVVAAGPPDRLARDDVAAAYLGRDVGAVVVPPPPEDATESITVTLRARELRQLERRAAEAGTDASSLASQAVRHDLSGEDAR